MKKNIHFVLISVLITLSSFCKGNNDKSTNKAQVPSDTIPDMCILVPPTFVDSLNPFGIIISSNAPDELNTEIYKGCFYRFFNQQSKRQIAVRLIKWPSKSEALAEYKMNFNRHFESWGRSPERINWVADSAYFTDNGEEANKCFDCGLVVLNGLYTIYISFAGDDDGNRDRKKTVSLYILERLCTRMPGLTPPRMINRQLPINN